MIAPCDAGEADCAGQAVRDKGNPTMLAVAVGNDSGDGSSCHGMHRIEATGVKWIMSSVEETISIRAVAAVLEGLLSASNALEAEVQREAIRERLSGQKSGDLRVGVLLDQSNGVNRRGDRGNECSGVRPAKDTIVTTEAVRRAKRWSCIGIGSHECRRDSHDGDSRYPVLALDKFSGKEPNLLLIGEEIRGEGTEGNLAIRFGDRCGLRLLRRRVLWECGSTGGDKPKE